MSGMTARSDAFSMFCSCMPPAFQALPRLQPDDQAVVPVLALQIPRRRRDRYPHVDARRERQRRVQRRPGRDQQRRRRDADHDVAVAVEEDRALEHGGIGGEAAAPQRVADDRDAIAAGLLFFGQERAPVGRRHAERGEEVRRHARGPDALRFAVTGEVPLAGRQRGDRRKRRLRLAPFEVVLHAHRQARNLVAPVGNDDFDAVELIGIRRTAAAAAAPRTRR